MKLIRELEKDSRQTNIELAKKLKVSEGTIRKRIADLVKDRVIRRFTVDLSTNDAFVAIVLLKTDPQIKTAEIVSKLNLIKGIKDIYETAGEWDVAIKVVVKSAGIFNDIIERIRRTKGIMDTQSLTVLNVG